MGQQFVAHLAGPDAFGLREFYDPHTGRGMGAEDFAWSALALELLDPENATAGPPVGGV